MKKYRIYLMPSITVTSYFLLFFSRLILFGLLLLFDSFMLFFSYLHMLYKQYSRLLSFFYFLPCSELCFVFQITWSCSQSITTTWTPKSIPPYKYLTYLTAFLSTRIATRTNRFLCFMTYTYTFTSHLNSIFLGKTYPINFL